MSAADTALQVLTWTIGNGMNEDPMPAGGLDGIADLAAAPNDIRRGIGRLAAVAAARLRLAPPPLGDPEPPGLATGVLAAAIGARANPVLAMRAMQAIAYAGPLSGYDLAARHALVSPALGLVDDDMGSLLRTLSPLTAVLDHPAPGDQLAAENLLDFRLLTDRGGYDLAVRTFAAPPEGPGQAGWRDDVLNQRRYDAPLRFVLDVYETGLAMFGDEHQRRLRQAQAFLGQPPDLAAAAPLVRWWHVLSEIERQQPDQIRHRRLISTEYVEGVRTYRRFAARVAVAAGR
jgi:FtsH ternary system domain X1